jgi:hypothetical protein
VKLFYLQLILAGIADSFYYQRTLQSDDNMGLTELSITQTLPCSEEREQNSCLARPLFLHAALHWLLAPGRAILWS